MRYSSHTLQSPCTFRAIGIMSGTSLDGLDICLSEYALAEGKWSFKIISAETIKYNAEIKEKLGNAPKLSGHDLMALDVSYGKWIGEQIKKFVDIKNLNADIIGSHGHTVFHEPSNGFSTQIGNGAQIAAAAEIPCVCNFRSGDVARGGQGAPLVPVGDEFLFSNFDICLNIGGIANLSYKNDGNRIAYDICPANMLLNYLANASGLEFDRNGALGRLGKVDKTLLNSMNRLSYYSKQGAKSLGREWFETEFLPIVQAANLPTADILRTSYEHISSQIAENFSVKAKGEVLITGGGAKNSFLVEQIKEKCTNRIIIPEEEIIDFKEALIFGLLAILYQLNLPSSLSSVTGANADSIGGCMYK